jgi:plastocyanin domain-containing protein
MPLDKLLVTLGGVGAIVFIVWFFWLWRRKGVQAAPTSSGHQEALILVKGGYMPDVIVMEGGRLIVE